MNVSVENKRGEWVPAIPEPWYLRAHRYGCDCGKATFWTKEGYQGHYAYAHILGMSIWNANFKSDEIKRKASDGEHHG